MLKVMCLNVCEHLGEEDFPELADDLQETNRHLLGLCVRKFIIGIYLTLLSR